MGHDAVAVEIEPRTKDRLEPGEFYFLRMPGADGRKLGIVHACPCGCGGRSALWFRGEGAGRAEWDVVGEWPKVTLTPSIGIRYDGKGNSPGPGQYHWHGYLRDGVFVEC